MRSERVAKYNQLMRIEEELTMRPVMPASAFPRLESERPWNHARPHATTIGPE